MLQLFGEIQAALRGPELVADLLQENELVLGGLPASVLLQLSDALNSDETKQEKYRSVSNRLLAAAAQGRLEEREVRRVGVGLLRNKAEPAVLSLIERNVKDHPEWRENASIAQLKGDALLGLAKRCRATAMRRRMPPASRERAWHQFHEYIVQAETELRRAESLSVDAGLSTIIRKNLAFLHGLKRDHGQRKR